MTSENEILSVIETLYAAAWGRADSRLAMSNLGSLFHASRVCTFNALTGPDAVVAINDVAASIDDAGTAANDFVRAFTPKREPQHPYLSFFARSGSSIARLEEIIDIEGFRRQPLWNEWMKPRDLDRDMRCVIEIDPALESRRSICIHRAVGQETFSKSEMDLLGLLLPHLRRAGATAGHLMRGTMDAAMNGTVSVAMLAVDKEGRIIRANAAADALLSSPEAPIMLREGCLTARAPAQRTRLTEFIADAFKRPLARQTGRIALLEASDESHRRHRFIANASPVPAGEIGNAIGELVLISIRRLDRPNDVDLVPFLTNLFGLSPAHARLAAWLSSGATLHEAAAACGITYSSARTYLAAVYAKTGTRHQGELVALVKTIEMAANG